MTPIDTAPIDAAAARSELIARALARASAAHAGQTRNGSGGLPYIEHPRMVASTLAAHEYAEATLAAALLHDVVEDSDTTVAELRAEFGDAVADLVAALSDDESIEDYRARKDEHRGRVEGSGGDAFAIYGADKLTNLRTLHATLGTEDAGQVAAEFKVPLTLKVEVWEADAEMLHREAPDLLSARRARRGDHSCSGGSSSGRSSSRYLSRRRSGSATQSTPNIPRIAAVVTTVAATLPKRTLVTSRIAQVIASASAPRPMIVSRLETKTRRCFC